MKHTHLLSFAFLMPLFMLVSCEKDNDAPNDGNNNSIQGEKVFVVNEGNFGSGNASLSYYNIENDTIIHGFFSNANEEPLGDVFQSITMENGLAYLVVNNSGKVEVIDPETGLRRGNITGLTSPRYLTTVNEYKAYVSDLFANAVSIIDLENYELSGTIPAHGWTEGMISWRGKIYVTGMQSGYLYEIDPATDTFSDSLMVSPGPESLVTDYRDNLWVLAGGAPLFKENPRIYEVDKNNLQIIREIELKDPDMLYSNLNVCPQGKTLYFLGGNVYKVDITRSELNVETFIPSDGRFFYALATDSEQGDMYVADPVDFVQAGYMLRYDADGQMLSIHQTGIIPGGFAFY